MVNIYNNRLSISYISLYNKKSFLQYEDTVENFLLEVYYYLSTIRAVPCPPPIHKVARPVLASLLIIS